MSKLTRRLVRLFVLMIVLALAPFAARAQSADPSGDWRGVLAAGAAHLRVAMHLGVASAVDSPDQNAFGMPAQLAATGRHVTVTVPSISAVFEGDVSEDGAHLVGEWRQIGQTFPFTLERGVYAAASGPQAPVAPFAARAQTADPSGDWRGVLAVGPVNLRVAMHLSATSSIDSPDQDAFGMPAQMATTGRHVTLTVPSISAVFEGDVSEDGARLVGVWRQSGQSFPFTLEHGVFAAANRPQTPVAPFPYRAEEVGYDNAQRPGVHLAGTLTIPEGRGRHPAVLLITGSGAQDRNEALMGHQPFLVLADYLSRRGFAVLRVDDRGVGGSTGATANDTMYDYATDVEAGVAFLRTRRDIDHRRVALLGHSEGGLIAPVVASHDPSLAAIVLWAGPGVRGADVMVEQLRAVLTASGAPADRIEAAAHSQRTVMDALLAAPDTEAARTVVSNALASVGQPASEATVSRLTSPWFRTFIAYDPAPTLSSLRMPVLALLGGKDVQVVATQNEPALRAALAGNPNARVATLPGLNHLFQTANTGAVAEYAQIEETIAPEALQAMGDWLTETLRPSRRRRN